MNKNIIGIASLFLGLTFFSPVSSFALMIEKSAEELAQNAKVIVQGEVKSVKSYKGINGVIYTRASVLVSDVIKGKNIKKNITVEYEGGEVGDIGVFSFKVKCAVLVFTSCFRYPFIRALRLKPRPFATR